MQIRVTVVVVVVLAVVATISSGCGRSEVGCEAQVRCEGGDPKAECTPTFVGCTDELTALDACHNAHAICEDGNTTLPDGACDAEEDALSKCGDA